MAVVVQKYGGSSVADVGRIQAVADRIVATRKLGKDVVAVVSAMGNTTNQLLDLARSVSPDPPSRELDMLVSVGERISMALLSMAIADRGFRAVSFTGSQSGIITDVSHGRARVLEVRPYRIQDELRLGSIVIAAGFQGVSYQREITTLGRGGSDTTAICLAAALEAEYCEICSDVDGVFTADPRVVPEARRIDTMTHDEMLEMARAGAKVLNAEAVEYARRHGIAIYARKTEAGPHEMGTIVRRDLHTERPEVTAISARRDLLLLDTHAQESAHALEAALEVLAELGPSESGPDRGSVSSSGQLRLAFRLENVVAREAFAERLKERLPGASVRWPVGSVTAVGPDVTSNPRVLREFLEVLAASGCVADHVTWSPASITATLPVEQVDPATRMLHHRLIERWARQ